MSCFCGRLHRTRAHTGSSFDLDLPMEVDDEYWESEDPDLAFRQPAEKPALVTAFVYWARLSQISAFVLRTLVSTYRFSMARHFLTAANFSTPSVDSSNH